jgi:hypothetical protein
MATRYLARSGCHYVKAIDGKPCFRSTQSLSEAARFDAEDDARQLAPNVFARSMLAAFEVVADPATGPAAAATRPAVAGGWTAAERFNDEPNSPWDGYMGR